MNDLPRQKLVELLAKQGPKVYEDPQRCRALLREQCGAFKGEIKLLVDAITEQVPAELLTAPQGVPAEQLLGRLAAQLQENLDLSPADARWAVETWALALKVIPAPLTPTPTPESPAPEKQETPPPAAPAPGKAGGVSIEQPACFYLGREYDLATQSVRADQPVMYDARDLLTHGVVVGMTGSGKTGLCISLIEEAAIDGISCILIDPKGDLTNLLLQFPELKPEDFEPWLNPEDARQKGISMDEHARQLAERWRRGLTESGQSPERIKKLQEKAEFRIYTPGSEAGLPLSILQTFSAPKGSMKNEDLNQKIDATTTALLGLTGISADPVQSREHILIAQLLLKAWNRGRDLDLTQLIAEIQEPTLLTKIGTLDVDTFYPEKERLKLAVALNNILASPSFSTWITGEPLDLTKLLGGAKKPRQLIFYVAHLDDAQRQFFITLLLEEVLSWTRRQAGATNLRAIVYFDEVSGYLPPHPSNPPTKAPLMTLLKQARAFGVGILLATQNPVDLDYKALSNAGTWFVGKLQTERDKARLMEGLEGVAAERGTLSNRSYLEKVISALGNRIFLLHDVHRGQPLLFQSRWALSFLRGPITRDQISGLMDPIKEKEKPPKPPEPVPGLPLTPVAIPAVAVAEPLAPGGAKVAAIPLCQHCGAELTQPGLLTCPACGVSLIQPGSTVQAGQLEEQQLLDSIELKPAAGSVGAGPRTPGAAAAPVVAGVTQYYIALTAPAPSGSMGLVYQPRLLAEARVAFVDRRKGVEHKRPCKRLAFPPPRMGEPVDWHSAEVFTGTRGEGPAPTASWAEVPETLNTPKKLKALERTFLEYVNSNAELTLYANRTLGLVSQPGEALADFREQCRERARKEAEQALAKERTKLAPKFTALHAEIPPEQPVQGSSSSWSLSGAFFDLLALGTPPSPSPRLSQKEQIKLTALQADWQKKRQEIGDKWRRVGDECEELPLKPRKTDTELTHFGLAWVPCWQVLGVSGQLELVPAYR
jgi:hypothetical protein